MRTAVDQMIDLAKVFSSQIELTKDMADRYMVGIRRVSSKENRQSCIISSVTGRGNSVEEACRNYMDHARGKLLVGDDETYYGKDRPEFVCV